MRYRLVILSCAAVTAAATAPSMLTAQAQDHGQMGQTWPVIEPDLLSVIKARLDHAQATGKLDEMNQQFAAKVKDRVMRPVPEPTQLITTLPVFKMATSLMPVSRQIQICH